MGGNNSKPSAEKIIDGKAIAATIRGEIKVGVSELVAKYGKAPGLAVVIVGSRPDSQTYVRMKRKACDEAGIVSFHKEMPEDASEEDVLQVVRDFNADPDCHGILVQLPLPKHMNEEKILAEISLQKDVDGFHPLNIGKLSMKGHEPLFMPCTPKGCIVLLERSGVDLKGKNAVVVGRSNIVGMPAALMLMKKDCTVTVVHSRTKNPERICREAGMRPEIREKILSEDPVKESTFPLIHRMSYTHMFPFQDKNYQPQEQDSMAAVAGRSGEGEACGLRSPREGLSLLLVFREGLSLLLVFAVSGGGGGGPEPARGSKQGADGLGVQMDQQHSGVEGDT